MKRLFKKNILLAQRLLFLAIYFTGLGLLVRIIRKNKLLVLTYHSFKSDGSEAAGSPYDHKFMEIKKFNTQLNYLKKYYTFISANDLLECISKNTKLPPYSLLITMDDGYEQNYTLAYPILKLLQIPAIIFIVTSFIDNHLPLWTDRLDYSLINTTKKSFTIDKAIFNLETKKDKHKATHSVRQLLKTYSNDKILTAVSELEKQLGVALGKNFETEKKYLPLSWKQIRAMTDGGLITIGGHTKHHPYISALNNIEQANEIFESKQLIENKIEKPCKIFAYPFGDKNSYNTETQKILQKNGFLLAFTTLFGHFNLSKNPLTIQRVSIDDRDQDKIDLIGKITFGRIV